MDFNSCDPNHTAESAQLVKTVQELRRYRKQQDEDEEDDEEDERRWAACKDFTVQVGKQQIAAYIQTWEIQACWLYSLDHLYTTEDEYQTYYHYRARFSTPTPRRPIQGTASVYFMVDKSKVKPQTLPVQVHFTVESNRLVHTAGRSRFREKWLLDVIESKTLLGRMMEL